MKYNDKILKVKIYRNELCACVLKDNLFSEFHVPNYLRQDCYVKFLNTYQQIVSSNFFILVSVICDNSKFIKELNYSHNYRYNKGLFIPDDLSNLSDRDNLKYYLNFLIDQYIEHILSNFNPSDSMSSSELLLYNPLYHYNNFSCSINNKFSEYYRHFIIYPSID